MNYKLSKGVSNQQDVKLNKGSAKVVRGRSYKDVLVGNIAGIKEESSHVAKVELGNEDHTNVTGVEVLGDVRPLEFKIYKKEKEWLNSCLIGQIVAMYDVDFVQQMLLAEGFKVSVSNWSGFYVVIKFEEEEQVDICWDLKDTVLKPWFTDIDTMENFMKGKKLCVWACIEGLPLKAWNDTVLHVIGSRWRDVIKLDPDTANKKRLDVARVLVGVKCLSVVPPSLHIDVDSVACYLRIGVGEYEDDRWWIDDENLNECFECPFSDNQGQTGKANRRAGLETVKVIVKENATDVEDVGVLRHDPNVFTKSHIRPVVSHKPNMERSANKVIGMDCGRRAVSEEKLYEVQVDAISESNFSTGHSVSIEPIFDAKSGLGSEKELKSPSMEVGEAIDGCKLTRDELDEARASLEVCESLGLLFDEDNEVLLKKFKELE
ncbi:hypothetical protein V6N13_098762 [Hibiscus sabdariffa]